MLLPKKNPSPKENQAGGHLIVTSKSVVTRTSFCCCNQGRKSWVFAHSLTLAVLLSAVVSHASDNPANRKAPAAEAFAAWVKRQGTPPTGSLTNAQALAAGLELARARAIELRSLMETDPQAFAGKAMSAIERSQLPAQLQPFVEQRVKGRGSFSVLCVFPKPEETGPATAPTHRGGYAFEAVIDGLKYRAFVYGPWRNQQTVSDAEIDGIALGDAIVLGDSTTPTSKAALASSLPATLLPPPAPTRCST